MSRGIFLISNLTVKKFPRNVSNIFSYIDPIWRKILDSTNFQCGFKKTWQNVEILQKIPYALPYTLPDNRIHMHITIEH